MFGLFKKKPTVSGTDTTVGLILSQLVLCDFDPSSLSAKLSSDQFALGYVFGIADMGNYQFNPHASDQSSALAYLDRVFMETLGSRGKEHLQQALGLQETSSEFVTGRATGAEELGAWLKSEGKIVPMGLASHLNNDDAIVGSNVAARGLDKGVKAHSAGDYAAALAEFRPLAEKGNARAQIILGNVYATGEGAPKDAAEAVRWYRLAAEQGNAQGQVNLGSMYANGEGVPNDDVEAVRWFRFAAEQGHATGQVNLGVFCANGAGVPKDAAEAVRWFRFAAEQGNAQGQVNLGVYYADGDDGVPKDAAEAVRWYRLAAEQGNAQGQNNLGLMYANGKGVLKDLATAHMWFNIASANGYEAAQQVREDIEAKMTREQIAEATKRAKVCMASNYQDCD